MPGIPDWEQIRREAARDLDDVETLRVLLPALSPHPDSGSRAFIPLALFPLIAAIRRWNWSRATKQSAHASEFPLAPRMVVGLTDKRLLVWASGRRRRLRRLLGHVPLDRIAGAQAPTVGAG